MNDHMVNASRYAIKVPPSAVGWWILPGSISEMSTKFSAYSKPNWLHRKMMLWLMGWKWENSK